ncbi:MAG: hypothetical protein IPF82_11585 [Blastocatellia bacterium]|nr:hypothetical protein [Blastocatellia bacterium]
MGSPRPLSLPSRRCRSSPDRESRFVTLADALTLGGGTAPPGRATMTMTNGSLRPSGKDCRSHVMGPLVPKSGAVVGVGMAKGKLFQPALRP